jgi:hypothetical protein
MSLIVADFGVFDFLLHGNLQQSCINGAKKQFFGVSNGYRTVMRSFSWVIGADEMPRRRLTPVRVSPTSVRRSSFFLCFSVVKSSLS